MPLVSSVEEVRCSSITLYLVYPVDIWLLLAVLFVHLFVTLMSSLSCPVLLGTMGPPRLMGFVILSDVVLNIICMCNHMDPFS